MPCCPVDRSAGYNPALNLFPTHCNHTHIIERTAVAAALECRRRMWPGLAHTVVAAVRLISDYTTAALGPT